MSICAKRGDLVRAAIRYPILFLNLVTWFLVNLKNMPTPRFLIILWGSILSGNLLWFFTTLYKHPGWWKSPAAGSSESSRSSSQTTNSTPPPEAGHLFTALFLLGLFSSNTAILIFKRNSLSGLTPFEPPCVIGTIGFFFSIRFLVDHLSCQACHSDQTEYCQIPTLTKRSWLSYVVPFFLVLGMVLGLLGILFPNDPKLQVNEKLFPGVSWFTFIAQSLFYVGIVLWQGLSIEQKKLRLVSCGGRANTYTHWMLHSALFVQTLLGFATLLAFLKQGKSLSDKAAIPIHLMLIPFTQIYGLYPLITAHNAKIAKNYNHAWADFTAAFCGAALFANPQPPDSENNAA